MKRSLALITAVMLIGSIADAQTTQPAFKPQRDESNSPVVNLWPVDPPTTQPGETEMAQERPTKTGLRDRVISHVVRPTITVLLPEHPDPAGIAVILIAGGGYGRIAIDKEGYQTAERLNASGIACFVLKYRLPGGIPPKDGAMPAPIQDAQRAIRIIRSHAEEWKINPHHVGVIGFSAGGNIAGTAATQFDAGDANASDPVERNSSRPDFAVLMYAVSSLHEPFVHAGSRRALLGENPDRALEDRFSTAQHITRDTPPLFLVHARDDRAVKIENSEQVADAAKQAGVPCEFMIFETGGHGFGLGPPGSEASGWVDPCIAWMRRISKE